MDCEVQIFKCMLICEGLVSRSCTISPYSPSLSTGFWLAKAADFSLALSLLCLGTNKEDLLPRSSPFNVLYCCGCICMSRFLYVYIQVNGVEKDAM